jgi:uncharacterized membrane protein
MVPQGHHFLPLTPVFFLALVALFALAVAMIEIGLLRYAYEKMGIARQYVYALLILSLLGSYINIPITHLAPEPVYSGVEVSFFGMRYVVPTVEDEQSTLLAVNLGGAVIPGGVAIYLLLRNRLFIEGLMGTLLVALCVHGVARPLPDVGVAVPTFVPPILAVAVAWLMSRSKAAPLAYIVGTWGTLIGADLMNLGKIQGLAAPVASIGGAGTFDSVFLTGVIAVLLA